MSDSATDKLLSTMAIPSLLDMDPLTFILTVLSILGLMFSAVNFLRHFTPTNLYVHAADSVGQTRTLYDTLDREHLLPKDKRMYNQVASHLELLEDKLKPLMFVMVPTRNVIQKLRAWTKIWKLLEISKEVEIFRVTIMGLSDHRKRINRAIELAEREGVVADLEKLEAVDQATAKMYISTLGACASDLTNKDVERGSCDLSTRADPSRDAPKTRSDALALVVSDLPDEDGLSPMGIPSEAPSLVHLDPLPSSPNDTSATQTTNGLRIAAMN